MVQTDRHEQLKDRKNIENNRTESIMHFLASKIDSG
jgi:hypothetical protein